MTPKVVYKTFSKAGHLIIYLGWISFMETLILNVLVYMHVYDLQSDMWL